GMLSDFKRLGELKGLTGDELQKFIEGMMNKAIAELKEKNPKLAAEMEAGAADAVEGWKKEMYKLPGGLDEIFNKLAPGMKKAMSGMFEVIDALPGKIGDKLRGVEKTITYWINRVDQILKGLHKIFGGIPDGLADMIGKNKGIFSGAG